MPDREANGRRSATLSRWLEQHPSVEIVSRDRSSTYASAITEANKNIVQTGDASLANRWHILANLTEGFEQFLNTQRQSIKEVAICILGKIKRKYKNRRGSGRIYFFAGC